MQILDETPEYVPSLGVTLEIRDLCKGKFYLSPQQMEKAIKEIVSTDAESIKIQKIIVSGETSNLSVYFISEKHVTVLSPLQPIKKNVILKEIFPEDKFGNEIMLTFPLTAKLEKRLKLPKVLLINPYIAEKYPVPRLPLSIAVVASYLRKYQKCQVWILDTQLGISLDTIKEKVLEVKPDIIGVSVPHGQTSLAISILDEIYSLISKKKINSKVVAGNFIAASKPEFFLKKYPGIIIARSEGENTMLDIVDYAQGKIELSNVSGIITCYKNQILKTNPKPTRMDDLPLPAMDNLDELCRLKGVLTHEWNRGCCGACLFCPRQHKPSKFKGMSPETVISQLKYFTKVMDSFELSNHLYVADEETIGGTEDSETERLIAIANGIIKNRISITFDAYARVDQVFNPQMSTQWHIKRMYMWQLLKKAGLSRLFVGLESGSIGQLKRYGKGITPDQSIMALRILTSLGIDVRIGFLMFDPLMNFQELDENLDFLERVDALVNPIKFDTKVKGLSELFELLHDDKFIEKVQLGEPICSRVSYMLAQLEVLLGSNYIKLLTQAEKTLGRKLISNEVDLNIGKIEVKYIDEEIELLARYSQQWIDNNFGVMYTIKGLRKTAEPVQEEKLFALMKTHRKISFDFLKAMMSILRKQGFSENSYGLNNSYKVEDENRCLSQFLEACLRTFMSTIEKAIICKADDYLKNCEITDTYDNRLKNAISAWRKSNRKLQNHG